MQTQAFTTPDGHAVGLRPVRPADAPQLQAFFAGLSAASRRWRFHGTVNGISAASALRLCRVDAGREIAFVATAADNQVIAEARLWIDDDGCGAEFAIAVSDAWAGQGLARRLMALLVASARRAGLPALRGDVLRDNERMLGLMQRCGFDIVPHPEDRALLRAEFDLSEAEESAAGWWSALAFLLPTPAAAQARPPL
jgi:acetyltransferase